MTQQPRALGGQDTGQEVWREVGTRSHPAERRQRELSSLHRSFWGPEAHDLPAQPLISPGKSRPRMKGMLCKHFFDVPLVNSATGIAVQHSAMWYTVENVILHYKLV